MKVAITGGIGSGKSFVCRMLEKHGISIYDCDEAAKRLMRTSVSLQQAISKAVGEEVFPEGRLDKTLLTRFIVASEENAQLIDSIVHPAVAQDFMLSGKDWLESAILFESNFCQRLVFDSIICVTAPLELRLQRIMQRDGISREKALAWINRQMPQEEKLKLSDYEIKNDNEHNLQTQVEETIRIINSKKINNNNGDNTFNCR